MKLVLIAFAITAIVGFLLALRVLSGRVPPWSLSWLHGSVGALGLFFLGYELFTGTYVIKVLAGFVILLVAALGGFVLFSYHLRQKIPPKLLVIIHAVVAVLGVLLLIMAASHV